MSKTKKTRRKPRRPSPIAGLPPKRNKRAQGGKISMLEAAREVLRRGASKQLNCKQLVEIMQARKLWKSPDGKTPDRTLYTALIREIRIKKGDSRFAVGDERGTFRLAA